jgi:hypothetical protein
VRFSVEEFLEPETVSEQKHEYVAGLVYAFAGVTRTHNLVVSGLLRTFLNAAEDSD